MATSRGRPEGWDLYLDDADDLYLSCGTSRVEDLKRFLLKQNYNFDRILAKGCFPIDYSCLTGDEELVCSWKDIARWVIDEPARFIGLVGLAMYQLLLKDVTKGCDDLSAHVQNVPKVVGRIQGVHPVIAIRDVKSTTFGKMVSVKGTVVRASNVNPYCLNMSFECLSCFHIRKHKLPNGVLEVPRKCERCPSQQLRPLKSYRLTEMVDRQTFRLQEFVEDDQADIGRVPRTIECELLGDVVDMCVPGDVVSVCGVVKTLGDQDAAKSKASSSKNLHLLYIAVNSISSMKSGAAKGTSGVQFTKKDYYAITEIQSRPDAFRLLVASLCPAIYGQDMVKAGLILALMGGTSRPAGNAQRQQLHVRGDSHVLLVGDPGLGKSQLLQSCAAVAPRGVYVCGNSSTTSGLTVTLTRERHNDHQLEAGALVLADQGCCCIDEFDKMSAHYQPLLEAMEQQTVSIAKGGIVCSLPARASVLAAANPSGGHYNRDKSVADNVRMGAALLSRFDLVFILLDLPDEQLDSLVSSHIMAQQAADSGRNSSMDASFSQLSSWDMSQPLAERLRSPSGEQLVPISHALLRKFIAYARKYVHPKLSPEACSVLQSFYLRMRSDSRDTGTPVTTRQLESLVRLTQARARLQLREIAVTSDAEDIIQLVCYTMEVGGGSTNRDISRPLTGRKPGKSGRLKRFVSVLGRSVQKLQKTIFSEHELKQLMGSGADGEFREFLEMANQAGVLIKKGHKLYQVQVD